MEHLAKRGHDVHVFTFSDDASADPNITVHKIGNARLPKLLWIPSYWLGLRKCFRRDGAALGLDVIIGNGFSELPLCKGIVDVPRILVMHQSARRVIRIVGPTLLERLQNINNEMGLAPLFDPILVKRADKVVAVSDFVKKSLVEDLNLEPRLIEVVHNGFNDFYEPLDEKETERWKRERGLSEERLLLFVGRVNDKRKGLMELIKAFSMVECGLGGHLLVVGGGDQGPAKALAAELGLESRVTMLGKVSDDELRTLYTICDIYVSSSFYESFGLTLVEAMSCKKPVIARDIGGIGEVVSDENGLLLRDRSVGAMADAITEMLKHHEKYADKGEGNRAYAIEKFSWARAAESMERIAIGLTEDRKCG